MKLVLYISLILTPCFAKEGTSLELQNGETILPENTESVNIEKSKEVKVRDIYGSHGGSTYNGNSAYSNNNPGYISGSNNGYHGSSNIRNDNLGGNFGHGNLGGSNFGIGNLGGSNIDNGNLRGTNFGNGNLGGSKFGNDNLGINTGSSNLGGLNNDFYSNRETILSYSKDYGSSRYRISVDLGALPWASGTFTYPDPDGRIYTINWRADRTGFYTDGPVAQQVGGIGGGFAPGRPFGKINVNLGGLPWASGTFKYPGLEDGSINTLDWRADSTGIHTDGPTVDRPLGGGAAGCAPVYCMGK